MPIFTISGTPINFPDSGASPLWSEAVIQFAELVTEALSAVVGPYDIPSQVLTLTNNINTNVNIDALNFPISAVRGFTIDYAINRKSSTETQVERGFLLGVYNADAGGAKWEMSRVKVGDASTTFAISDTGQVSFTTTALGGVYTTGQITFSAKALEQS